MDLVAVSVFQKREVTGFAPSHAAFDRGSMLRKARDRPLYRHIDIQAKDDRAFWGRILGWRRMYARPSDDLNDKNERLWKDREYGEGSQISKVMPEA
jgi:hypothetical protein